jgi:hypothetical protein
MHSDTTPEAVGLRRRVLRDLTGNDRLREALKLSDAERPWQASPATPACHVDTGDHERAASP